MAGVALRHYDIIRAPLITEKTTALSEYNKIVFEVASDAGKSDIKNAIEALFEVNVTSVNTMRRKGKLKRFRGKWGKRRDVKRAIVTLREGQSIDVATGL